MKKLIIGVQLFAFALVLLPSAKAQDVYPTSSKVSIEVDPVTFLFKGYSLHLRLQPKGSSHLFLGLGTYALDLPNFMVNFNQKNKNRGWDVRLNQGHSAFAEYHFEEVNKGWFTGIQAGLQEHRLENSGAPGRTSYQNLLLMTYGGYTWAIPRSSFYIKFWGGLGYSNQISGSNEIENTVYDISPISWFGTFHLGCRL